jgi:small-conductance mechanosensitive channel
MQEPIKDLSSLIAMLNIPVKQAIDVSEQNRRSLDEMARKMIIQEERLVRVADENKELRLELRERSKELKDQISVLEATLLTDQKKRTNMIIGSQATVLLLIVGAFITYIFLFLPRH